jgi:hypothetical protein
MSFLDLAYAAADALGFDDIVGNFLGDAMDFVGLNLDAGTIDFIKDIGTGALTNAAIAGIAGGDIGEAAIYGAAGGAAKNMDLAGYGDYLGAGIGAYGLGEATGGNGLLSAGAAMAGKALSDRQASNSSEVDGATNAKSTQPGAEQAEIEQLPATTEQTGELIQLEELGLSGHNNILGQALVAGIGGMAQHKTAMEAVEQNHKNDLERMEKQKELDREAEAERTAAFAASANPFQFRRAPLRNRG